LICASTTSPDLHFSFVFFVRSSNVLSFERLIEPIQRFKTFGDLASYFTQSQLCCLSSIGCLIDVFDRYDLELSIKSAERDRRSSLTSSRKVFQVIDQPPTDEQVLILWSFLSFLKVCFPQNMHSAMSVDVSSVCLFNKGTCDVSQKEMAV
jgi:hypothetical protein